MAENCSKCERVLEDDPGDRHPVSISSEHEPRFIKIIVIPAGEAPKWVRREWVGLILPLALGQIENLPGDGVLSGKPSHEKDEKYQVNAAVAISILKKKSPQAAEWWEENFHHNHLSLFLFPKAGCKIAS